MNNAIRKFLSTGTIGRLDPGKLATACNDAIRQETQRSLKSAVALARKFVRHAKPHGGILLSTSYRAQGWALHVSGKYKQAERSYLKARMLVKRDPGIRARIDRILIDTYMYLGDFDEARRRARIAMATFRRLEDTAELSKTRVNYANLLHRQDRHREAYRQYRLAADYFRHRGDKFALALCRYNQANTLVQLFDYSDTGKLYSLAEKAFTELGYDLYANECRYGMSWLFMLRGDYHQALQGLSDCEKSYRKAGHAKGVMLCELDRAEAYLGLNLFTDARTAAKNAWKQAQRLGLDYEASKAAAFAAKALHAMGYGTAARKAMTQARDGFKAVNNQGFLAVAELSIAQLTEEGHFKPARLEKIRRRFSQAQLPLWEAICDLQHMSKLPDDQAALRRLGRNPAVKTVPHLYALWQTMLGDRKASLGQIFPAKKHWANAVERLDNVRAKLPPVEMREAFLQHRTDPYLRLVSAELSRNPDKAAVWSELQKTSGLWTVPEGGLDTVDLRSRAENSLSELAERVASLSTRISDSSGKRTGMAPEVKRAFTNLQRQVCADLAALESSRNTTTARFEAIHADLQTLSRRYPVAQFHYDNNDLIAFVHCDGTTRFHRYVDGRRRIAEYVGCWQVLLSRAIHPDNQNRSFIEDEHRLFSQIGKWLWMPLEIPSRKEKVLIIPEGKICNLPWSAIRLENRALADSHSVVIAPSIRHHLQASGIRVRSEKVAVFVGGADDLPHARREITAFNQVKSSDLEVHDPCRRSSWPSDGQAHLWHFTGHAVLRSDNPFYSSLSLADGPLFAADFRLKRCQVGLVTMAACRTGQQTYLPGEESTGLVRSLLEMGAKNIIASNWAVSDEPTALWMQQFYQSYLSGRSLETSMRAATTDVRHKYASAYNWAAFSLFGA